MPKINTILLFIFLILVALFVYKTVRVPENSSISVNQKTDAEVQNSVAGTMTEEEFDKKIHDYIVNHPEVLIKSVEALHKKKSEESSKQTTDYLGQNKALIEGEGTPPILGNKDADITVVMFYDYNCSFCKQANDINNEILRRDPGIKIVLRPVPILGGTSLYATKVALAVHKISEEKFPLIHNAMINMQSVTEEAVKNLLAENNIDYSIVENEINSFAAKELISKNLDLAQNIGVKGAPSYVINGIFIPGLIDINKFISIISQLRHLADSNDDQESTKEQKQDKNQSDKGKDSNTNSNPNSKNNSQ